ncbi:MULTISPECIES: GGDEF domain-containing protein [Nocardia]|uniref:Diguanylate cyclase n=1 Tax=Nocardia aurea TaxID=2144174 RepID=A0ABV3G0R5_9NOCA|nr:MULTISPECIES: diguanylate cyclase [Nocardia]
MDDDKTLRAWWHDPVDYYWLIRTLSARSALLPLKWAIGLPGISLVVLSVVIAGTPFGPTGDPSPATVVGVVSGALWTLRWVLFPWPGKTESLLLMAFVDVLFTVEFLQVTDRLFGAMGAILFVVSGSYLAFFHSAKVLAVHAVWALFSVILLSTLVATDGGDVRLAVATALLMVGAVAGALPALQFMYWILRTESLSDPLTELLNRRGLENRLPRLIDGHSSVCVMTFDLDRFKSVNDNFGHRVGDTVLIRTAKRLYAAAEAGSVVARTGGEEFVVAAPIATADVRAEAERLRRAVAATAESEVEVTASVGVAVFDAGAHADSPRPAPEMLLHRADAAMYRAKESGGNLVVIDELTPPLGDEYLPPLFPDAR